MTTNQYIFTGFLCLAILVAAMAIITINLVSSWGNTLKKQIDSNLRHPDKETRTKRKVSSRSSRLNDSQWVESWFDEAAKVQSEIPYGFTNFRYTETYIPDEKMKEEIIKIVREEIQKNEKGNT